MQRLVSIAICVACISSTAVAGIVRVPGDSPTIQGGIQLAASGDTVLVDQGVYFETLVIPIRLVLLSEHGPELTVIDADGAAQDVILLEDAADGSTVEGFTVRGANEGSGIYIGYARGTIRNNVVEDNVNNFGTAGITILGLLGAPSVIEGNVIRGNLGGKSVAGIRAGNADVRDNWIEGNVGVETVQLAYGSFTGNVVVGNSTGWTLRLEIVDCSNNTIANNENGIGVTVLDGSFDRNILEHNGNNVALECWGAAPAASCNVFWGTGAPLGDDCAFSIGEKDNVYADPLFCDPENGDYRLAANSPAAVGSCGLIGALPVGCGVAGVLAGESAPPAVPSLRAYPNPARASVSFELSGAAQGRVHIFDVGGRLVDTVLLRSGRGNWDAREVPAGVYWLRVDGAIGAEARLVLAR